MRQADNDLKTPIRTLTVATMLFSSSITDTFAGSFAQIDVAEDSKTLIFATKVSASPCHKRSMMKTGKTIHKASA
ncbi:hypothetical protein BOW44_12930 [Solemya velum gill symbiont]|nr:hypothetical protein BOW44_12930 [Solemya velum gill symbiont]